MRLPSFSQIKKLFCSRCQALLRQLAPVHIFRGISINLEPFAQKGVDQIICLSVNDAWVMDAWGKAQGADGKVTMVGDGNGDLSRELGFLVDMGGAGFGERSIRYAMIIENGVVTHLNVEAPREFKISDAGTMLQLL